MYRQASGCDPSTSVKPYSRARPPEEKEPPLRRWRSGSAARAATARPTIQWALRDGGEVGVDRRAVAPVLLGDAVVVQHHLRAEPARGQSNRGASVRRELDALREGEADDGGLGQVVEHRVSVVLGVVLLRAVGHLDDQPAGVADQQRQREVARNEVRVDREAEHPQPVLEVVLPDGRVPLEELFSAPDVVHEHIETPAFGIDPLDERLDLARLEMVDCHRDPTAPGAPSRARRFPRSSPGGCTPNVARRCCGPCSRPSRLPLRARPPCPVRLRESRR